MKQKVKEWKKKKAEAKKKKELEKQAQTTTTPTTSDKPSELDTAKTAQPEIEAGMPVYEVQYRQPAFSIAITSPPSLEKKAPPRQKKRETYIIHNPVFSTW